jgi:DHA1 family bicyclomycin/chloramphenicol resistance-like MFS transporter
MNAPVPPAPVMSVRRVTLIGALLIAVGPISMALYTPAMPEIALAFATSDAAVKMTLTVYFAGFAFAQLVCGPLSDGFGRRPVTLGFMGVYLTASLIALYSPNIETLILARFLQGIGAAVGMSISRAIVRDLFTSDASARIMNFMGMILAVGPALSPAIGGLTMQLFGWHAIFILMVLLGVAIVWVTLFSLRETVVRDLSRIRPRALVRSYRILLSSPYFMLTSLVAACTVGALYTQATILPFIMMETVGLSPAAFGFGMLMQSGLFFLGTLGVRLILPRLGAYRIVPIGLAFVAAGSVLLAVLLRLQDASFLGVMGPIGVFAFGIAFVMPAMLTASMAPFPRVAGAASSLTGFMQMGAGLLGGSICALFTDPVRALATVVPTMGLIAIVSWLLWRRLPDPELPVPAHPERAT